MTEQEKRRFMAADPEMYREELKQKLPVWNILDLVKDLKHVVTVLCETRGHAGRRPCEFCSDMHLWKVRQLEAGYKESDARSIQHWNNQRLLRDIERERDEAVSWIRVVSEELVEAGGQPGDRTVALANLRQIIKSTRQSGAECSCAIGGLAKVVTTDVKHCPIHKIWAK